MNEGKIFWENIFAFFIDEIGIMRCSDFNRISARLQRYRNNFEEPFRDFDLFITRDSSQLGVMSSPLYRYFYLQTVCILI